MTGYDYVAFGAMFVVFVAMIWLVIFLGDLPANIAKQRKHSQVAAIRALSWFGLLFTGGILWILAVVWAYFDSSSILSKFSTSGAEESASTDELKTELDNLRKRLTAPSLLLMLRQQLICKDSSGRPFRPYPYGTGSATPT